LLHDAHGLAHFLHSDKISVIAVAMFADRNVEIEFRIALVGLRLAQVPCGTTAPHHDTREAPAPGVRKAHLADADVALLENPILCKQQLEIREDLKKRFAK